MDKPLTQVLGIVLRPAGVIITWELLRFTILTSWPRNYYNHFLAFILIHILLVQNSFWNCFSSISYGYILCGFQEELFSVNRPAPLPSLWIDDSGILSGWAV
jgi:hypothetical protein